MIQVKDVVKSFDGNVVLDHISADFEDGKVNMIIGQSGSGKTVLMKSMIGLHTIDSGEIIFDTRQGQQNLAEMAEKEVRLLHREVGMLFQGAALFDSICLSRVDMPERAYGLMPSEISGGMQKRVAIARAIALNPRYLFCDEPNSGLDPKTSLVIDKLIQDITQEYGICTIVNSHDMNSIMEIGDNIVFLRNGVKEWQGSRHEIFQSENEALNDFVFASELFKKVKSAAR